MNHLNIISGIWHNPIKDKLLDYVADLPTPSSYLTAGVALLFFASTAESAFDSSNYLPTACVVGAAVFMGITGAARYWVHRQVEEFKNELQAPPEHKNRAALTLLRIPNEERISLVQQTNNLNIPDAQRLDAFHLLAALPPELRAEIVNQANNLNIPNEQRFDALNLLVTIPPQLREEIVNQANNLNIPNEQRFDALNLLVTIPPQLREEIVNQANNLNIPQERRLILVTYLSELGQERHEFIQKIQQIDIAEPILLADALQTLRLIPQDQRIVLLDQAARLISAEMTGQDKLSILQSLAGVSDEQRLQFVELLRGHLQVHPQSIFSHGSHSKIAIITAFFQIPNAEKIATIERMPALARLCRDHLGIETPNVLTMLEIARNVPEGQFQELIAYGKSFTNVFTTSRQKLQILHCLSRVHQAHRHQIARFINFRMSQSEKIEILEACSRISANCFDCVIQKFSNLIDITTKFKDRKQLIIALAKIPSRSWLQFHVLPPEEQERVLANLVDIPDNTIYQK